MKRMNVKFEGNNNRTIPPAPRVVVPDTGVYAGRSQSENFDSGDMEVRMRTEKTGAASWNYAFGPPPAGVDPEFDRRVASELARNREAKEREGGGGEGHLINSSRGMMRDKREENQEWSRKNMDFQLGTVNELRELSNNIPDKTKFEHDVAVALKQMKTNGLTLQHGLPYGMQQSESMSHNANVDSIPLMHLGDGHLAEDENLQLGSDKPSKSNPDSPQVHGRTHDVEGLQDTYTGMEGSPNPSTYSRRWRSGGLSSMWQGEEGSALQRGEAIEKQKRYRHELQQQIQERQHFQEHDEHQHTATPIPYIGGGIGDRNAKISFGYNSRDGKNGHHLTSECSQLSGHPLGVNSPPGGLPSKTGLFSSMSQPWEQQPMIVDSGTRHAQTVTTVSNNRSSSNHASPLVGVSCSATMEEKATMKEEYAKELRKQIAEKSERKASQLREEEAMLVKEVEWEKYGDIVNEAASRHRGSEELCGISDPFPGIGSPNRLQKEIEDGGDLPRQQIVDSAGLTMSSSLPTPSSNPPTFGIENGLSHPGSSIGLSARQRLMEDVYGTAAGLSIQLLGMQGRESGTEEMEKARCVVVVLPLSLFITIIFCFHEIILLAIVIVSSNCTTTSFTTNRKKCIALEQQQALEEQIEAKSRLREETEARKRHEDEEEQRRMMREQLEYENEQRATREKHLAEEQVRMIILRCGIYISTTKN